jgi:hypothetical protein
VARLVVVSTRCSSRRCMQRGLRLCGLFSQLHGVGFHAGKRVHLDVQAPCLCRHLDQNMPAPCNNHMHIASLLPSCCCGILKLLYAVKQEGEDHVCGALITVILP